MIKFIALLKAKPGISRQAFMDHYEHVHVPLILGIAPPLAGYRRNYLPMEFFGQNDAFPHDCIAELCFPDQAACDSFFAALSQPNIQALVAADEEQFLDRTATRFFMVEERS